MKPTIILKIQSLQSSFTVSEAQIANFIVNNPNKVISSTISDLAGLTKTSEASINRFCKKIGIKGFNRLKISLAANDNENESKQIADKSNVIESLLIDYFNVARGTAAMLNQTDLDRTAQLLVDSTSIHIYSDFTYQGAASNLSLKLNELGLRNFLHTNNLSIRLELSDFSANDAFIFMVNSPLNKNIFPLLVSLKDQNVNIILISSINSTKIMDITDVRLITPDYKVSQGTHIIDNSLTYNFVIDLIVATLLSQNKTLRQKKLSSQTLLEIYQSTDSSTFDY